MHIICTASCIVVVVVVKCCDYGRIFRFDKVFLCLGSRCFRDRFVHCLLTYTFYTKKYFIRQTIWLITGTLLFCHLIVKLETRKCLFVCMTIISFVVRSIHGHNLSIPYTQTKTKQKLYIAHFVYNARITPTFVVDFVLFHLSFALDCE